MEVFVQNSPIHCIFRLPSVTDRFNPNIQFPDRICYSDTLPGALRMMSYNLPPPQIREDAICSGVVESHGAGCCAREASKMTAAPTAISTCGEQQQSA